jgi:hypothetical protein
MCDLLPEGVDAYSGWSHHAKASHDHSSHI